VNVLVEKFQQACFSTEGRPLVRTLHCFGDLDWTQWP